MVQNMYEMCNSEIPCFVTLKYGVRW